MQTKPKVSIVIIAYNEERFIKEAIESALNQTYENIEVIFVDDGSKDQTVSIAKQYESQIKIIRLENSGNCCVPRNAGLGIAQGEYVSFLDGDDLLLPSKISDQIAIFQHFPEAALVVSNYCNFKNETTHDDHFSTCPRLSKKFLEYSDEDILLPTGVSADIMLDENFTITSSILMKTEKVRMLGGFCADLHACEDFHLNYRLGMRFPMAVGKRVLFRRRLHDSNTSSNSLKMSRFYYESRWMLLLEETDRNRKIKLKLIVKSYLIGFLRLSLKMRSAVNVKRAIIGMIKFPFS